MMQVYLVSSHVHSLSVGPDGPILLQDHYLIEQIANFNRERIPERQPHAKGSGAFGYFQVTQDVSRYTKAAVFQPKVRTDTIIRFSTVAGERGSPDTWRHMNGYSTHTYMWYNEKGEKFWVKYHFKTDQGIECLTQKEADILAGEDADCHRRDLSEAIKNNNFPGWTLMVQIIPFNEARTYRINPFDLTKVWPHSDYPLHEVGKLVLNQNPTDFHTQIEQAAFEPNSFVPGTGPSPDKMLLGRLGPETQ